MKRRSLLVLSLALLSLISGFLLSKATLIGRTGINLFYKEYKFLKVWWQGSLVVFVSLMLLFGLHSFVQMRLKKTTSNLIHLVAVIASLIGLYFTYNDFRHTLNHRLLGERFHLGAYLFWVGWIVIGIYFLSFNARAKYQVPDDPYIGD